MSRFDDDENVMGGFWSRGASTADADDAAIFDAARAVLRAAIPAVPPVASPELTTFLREGAPRRSRMNPMAKIASLGLAGKLAVAGGVALAASAGGLTVAGLATSGNSHAAAGLARAAAAGSNAHNTSAPVSDPTVTGSPDNHGTCVSAAAHATPAASASPNSHGQAVAAVAQSDCGKPATASGGKPTALPTQANSQAATHPTAKPTALPTEANTHAAAHPTGAPSSAPPAHPTGQPTSHPGG